MSRLGILFARRLCAIEGICQGKEKERKSKRRLAKLYSPPMLYFLRKFLLDLYFDPARADERKVFRRVSLSNFSLCEVIWFF